MMNGYAQLKARYPELNLPRYVFTENEDSVKKMSYAMVVEMNSQQPVDMSDKRMSYIATKMMQNMKRRKTKTLQL
jgi:hypothetical protein